ncbi:MAG: ester cyclase [Anaerolineae bacterium]|nr:ester cyclase [Anaerolineae bacterium]
MMRRKIAISLVSVFTCLWAAWSAPVPSLAQGEVDPVEFRHKEIVRTVVDAIYTQGNVGVMDGFYTPTFTRHPSNSDLLTVKVSILALKAAIPDLRPSIPLIIADGNLVAFRLRLDGTLVNELVFPNSVPIPATNQPITLLTNIVMRFDENNLIAEEWDGFDNLGFLVQIGAIPPPQTEPVELPLVFNIQPSPREQQNKEATLAYYDGLSRNDFSVIDAYLRPDMSAYSVFGKMDRTAQNNDLSFLRNAMPDLSYTVDQVLAEANWTAVMYHVRGSFTQPYAASPDQPIQPTNQPFDLLVVTLYQFDEQGQVVESYELFDSFSFLSQLGLNVPRVPGS